MPKIIKKTNPKEEIIWWFKMVCKGIRQEYERGASYRKLEIDVTTLRKLLSDYKIVK